MGIIGGHKGRNSCSGHHRFWVGHWEGGGGLGFSGCWGSSGWLRAFVCVCFLREALGGFRHFEGLVVLEGV